MLSDRERIVLNDIERELGANDPELAQRLSGDASAGRTLWRYWLASGVLGMLLLISIGADLPVLTMILAMTVAGVATAAYHHRRKHGIG